MRNRLVPFAVLLFGATGLACADHRDILGSGAELTSTPCSSCASSTMPLLECPSDRAPRCFQRTDGTCGWKNACAEPTTPVTVTCGGLAGQTCGKGQYCNFPATAQCGAADQTGTCTAIPDGACTTVYAPVCGCDGKTYGNACTAATAGVSVASNGECAPGSGTKACGGIAGLTCAKGQYCNFPATAQCGAADQTGTCTAIPDACDLVYAAVCGCDGKTYGNACSAAAAGVSVANNGECATGSGTNACGGIAGIQCAKGQYCNFPATAQCGAADQTGTCTAIPDGACTTVYAPVCGCDGKTYGNACTAATAGVSVAKTGECAPTTGTKTCGGIAGLTCAKGQYCDIPPDAHCGAADQTGVCAPIPDACTLEYGPVCGCDGKTYGNACNAASAGVSVSGQGPCA